MENCKTSMITKEEKKTEEDCFFAPESEARQLILEGLISRPDETLNPVCTACVCACVCVCACACACDCDAAGDDSA